MIPITIIGLLKVMPRSRDVAAAFIGPLNQAFARWDIATPRRISAFLAQAAHESAELTKLEEDLRYSAGRLVALWPRRFTPAEALAYEGNPEAIGNRVYGGRLGNGPEASGDGWRYRGRGIFQLTGRANYRDASIAVAGDADTLLVNPELVAEPVYACQTAGWYWASQDLNALADVGDVETITRRINGGRHGLAERVAYWQRALAVFERAPVA